MPHRWSAPIAATLVGLVLAACGDDVPASAQEGPDGGDDPAGESSTGDDVGDPSASTGGEGDGTSGTGDGESGDGDTGESGTTTGGEEPAWVWNLPPGFPEPLVPEDNPMTAQKVELGRHLFYDVRLSANETQSCGTCHVQELAFTDGLAVPEGSTGEVLARNSMSLANVAYSATHTWANPLFEDLEAQLMVPIFGENPVEIGASGHEEEILQRFRDDGLYRELFAAAFPDEEDPFDFLMIRRAIASFVRTMISGRAPYDRYVYDDDNAAISEAAKRGAEIFLSEALDCHHCHNAFNFTISVKHANTVFTSTPFHNTGLYDVDGQGSYPASSLGLIEVTLDPEDMGKFKPPTLRNIAVTGPYAHDGSVATLSEMIDIYAAGGRNIEGGPNAGDGRLNPFKDAFVHGFDLTEGDKADLLEFFDALTDEEFLTNPALSDPWR